MESHEKIEQLSTMLEEQILPLIDHDYVLYGLPYYPNIGDTLIWEGELELLKKSPFKCVGVCGWSDYPIDPVAKDNIILIQGGGYFGDLWRGAWKKVLEGIKFYKKNKIIILPNTIYYHDNDILQQDISYLAEFSNLIICARDSISYQFALEHFKNRILLLPDMAFCIKPIHLNQWIAHKVNHKKLFLKRIDKELGVVPVGLSLDDFDVRDWPTMEETTFKEKVVNKLSFEYHRRIGNISYFKTLLDKLYNAMYYFVYRRSMLKRGIKFISSYDVVYATRLHVMILSILLDKEVKMIDNKYGKLSSFYETWLRDLDNVQVLK